MALKTFTSTRTASTNDGKYLSSWHLSAGGIALVARFCDGSSANPQFEVQLPINTSASQAYGIGEGRPFFPNGVHVEIVSGTLNRGCIDI